MKSYNSQKANHWINNYILSVLGALYKSTRNELPKLIFKCDFVLRACFAMDSRIERDGSLSEVLSKEVCGLGQQQVCDFECNKAVIDLTLTGFALVERWTWNRSDNFLTRHRAPWDNATRRPSPKSKYIVMHLKLLWQNYSAQYAGILTPTILRTLKSSLFDRILCT